MKKPIVTDWGFLQPPDASAALMAQKCFEVTRLLEIGQTVNVVVDGVVVETLRPDPLWWMARYRSVWS